MANGSLSVAPGILQKPTNQSGSTTSNKAVAKRTAQPRLKLLVRRLSPGLTEHEFLHSLGPEWKVGAGKIDWFVYRHGKISRDPAKPSRPARAYLHVVDASVVHALSDKVRQTTFQDAKNTTKDLALLGPPAVEFAPYTKIPASRKRKDARQGTIDQDPEFMAFLDSLTDPIQKPAVDLEPSQKPEKWSTTPLIEHLREKKAKKEKPAASKLSKKDAKEVTKAKSKETPATISTPAVGNDKSKKQVKPPKAKETVKVLNRPENSTSSATPATGNVESSLSAKEIAKKALPERRRDRPAAQFNLAAKIQRDLGLNQPPRRAASASKESAASSSASTTEATQTAPVAGGASPGSTNAATPNAKREVRGRDRRNSKPPKPEASKSDIGSPAKATNQTLATTATVKAANGPADPKEQSSTNTKGTATTTSHHPSSNTRAFLKHANASQGITEALLRTALATFGPVAKVEIDQKKGTAFADFATPQGLATAVAKGKIDVGKGTVVIAEYRERSTRVQRPAVASTSAPSAPTSHTAQSGLGTGNEAGRGRGARGRGGRGRAPSSQAHGQKPAAAGKSVAATANVTTVPNLTNG